MSIWWDQHEKYHEALLNHTTFETDEAFEQFVHVDNSKKKKGKGKKKKGKKNKKKKAAKKAKKS